MTKALQLSRRTMLKGVGTAMALPLLEAMWPAAVRAGVKTVATPNRMAFLYVPNGINMKDWTPDAEGAAFKLPFILEPLEPFRQDLLVLSGLAQDKAHANGDGPGDHARAAATFLTGVQARKTHGADIKVGVSVDQIAAQRVGALTKFPSLELGCEQGQQAGNCDSGYSCAYSSNISWRTESSPVAKEVNPRLVFERLFADTISQEDDLRVRQQRDRYHQSILDFVLEDAQSLHARLGASDRRKLDEYLSSVRELERRVARTDQPAEDVPQGPRPKGIPKDYGEHLRLMCDMLVLAFQGDLTRVSTFLLANESSNRSYPFIGVPDGHHDLSHHGRDEEKMAKIRKINRFHLEQFAYLLGKLKSTPEGSGTLLDHVMIVYGSGISDGNRHNHNKLPIVLAGHGCGTLETGRHVRYADDTPLCNLYLSMLDRLNVDFDKLGDSTGRLDGLSS